jgi:indolepyruvate decarboxylase
MAEVICTPRCAYIEVINSAWTEICAEPSHPLAAIPSYSDPGYLKSAVQATLDAIFSARHPVFLLGVELQRFGLQQLTQELVNLTQIPFTTTSLAKTVLDESQALFAGTYAGPASPSSTNRLVTESDCVIALGTIITDDYLNLMASSFSKMIRVSEGETRVDSTYFATVTLADFLAALLDVIRREPMKSAAKSLIVPFATPLSKPKRGLQLTYELFYEILGGFMVETSLRESAILILGESTSLYVFGNLFGLAPNSFVAQAAWGSLGHETGCALGVGLGTGKRPIVVAGDGGFMMTCQEVSSLVQAQSDAVVFVMSNHGYAIEQAFVDLRAFEPGGSFAPFDVLPVWDYPALAKAFGARGIRVASTTDLIDFLEHLGELTSGPTLVEVVIPEHDLAPQLRRLAEPPPTERRYYRAENPAKITIS